ncbi:MAG: ABC transporter substrate-binding protein [Candidatus Aminicenantales bacterium]
MGGRSRRQAFGFLPLVLFHLCLLGTSLWVVSCSPQKKEETHKTQIAVIPKGMTHEFWKAIHAGAVKAGRELGITIIWKGPHKEDDREAQIAVVEDMISRKVDGIVLAPLDDRALVRPVQEAGRDGIPVVIIDSPLQGDDYISYIATDNFKGGVLAAQHLGRLLEGQGRIFLIRCHEGSASTTLREQGFYETMKRDFPEIEFLSRDLYAGVTTESAYQTLENLLSRYPEVDGLFCPNESTTFGALRALEDKGMAGRVKFVGFDSSPKLVDGIRSGHLHGLVLQNPFLMGYQGVKTVVSYLKGERVPERVDTGETLVTPENMFLPEIQALLFPDIKSYLQ